MPKLDLWLSCSEVQICWTRYSWIAVILVMNNWTSGVTRVRGSCKVDRCVSKWRSKSFRDVILAFIWREPGCTPWFLMHTCLIVYVAELVCAVVWWWTNNVHLPVLVLRLHTNICIDLCWTVFLKYDYFRRFLSSRLSRCVLPNRRYLEIKLLFLLTLSKYLVSVV